MKVVYLFEVVADFSRSEMTEEVSAHTPNAEALFECMFYLCYLCLLLHSEREREVS